MIKNGIFIAIISLITASSGTTKTTPIGGICSHDNECSNYTLFGTIACCPGVEVAQLVAKFGWSQSQIERYFGDSVTKIYSSCQQKQKDWAGIYYCPADCVGKPLGKKGSCK